MVRQRLPLAAVALAAALSSRPAAADGPSVPRPATADPALAVFAGAATLLAGFAAGGALLARSNGSAAQDNAGWLTIESGFSLAPLLAHGVVGEWTRGLAFSAAPFASELATGGLFYATPNVVDHGTLPAQRAMWALFGLALFSGAVGVVDVAFAPERAGATLRVAPEVGAGNVGIQVGGAL